MTNDIRIEKNIPSDNSTNTISLLPISKTKLNDFKTKNINKIHDMKKYKLEQKKKKNIII